MLVYKGTDKDMRCRGLQYEIGKPVEANGDISICNNGLHACEMPLDVLNYYPPCSSRYFVGVLDGVSDERSYDSKRVGRKLELKMELNIAGLIKAQINYVRERTTLEGETATGERGAASATDFQGAASATGNQGAASATGDQGAASATGFQGAASATGNLGAASATGNQGAASATGKNSVSVSTGVCGRVMGALGCAVVCVERGDWDGETRPIKSILAAVVDGDKIKPGVWYTVKDGQWVEAEE
nr:MAG TPA: hypothetical protein [Caudoviricetes sp.]